MELPKIIEELERKKRKLEGFGALSSDQQRKLDDKFRLEFNWNSNHIEGNTMTYGETQLLLMRGKVTGDHDKQEIDEMSAHDVAFDMIKDWAKTDRDISESELRELNRVILVKSFWKGAFTLDKQRTRKQILPGEYKTSPNSVFQKDGQEYHYASPEETPVLMKELMDWYHSEDGNKYPVIKAAKAHHRFTEIHPFDDGNGRVARLWLNFILLRAGYPPLIIKSDRKKDYLTALVKADAGDFSAFVQYIGNALMWSLDLSLKAAKGESLDEAGDLDKKIDLLDRKFQYLETEEAKISRSKEAINNIILGSVKPLSILLESKVSTIRNWFNDSHFVIFKDSRGITFQSFEELADEAFIYRENESLRGYSIEFELNGFKKAGTKAFNERERLYANFDEWSYQISFQNSYEDALITKLYNEQLTDKEMNSIAEDFVGRIIKQIENRAKRLDLL